MKKKFLLFSCFLLSAGLASFCWHLTNTHATFNANNIIDDGIFDRYYSMSAGQIDTWLNANFANSCISTNRGFTAPDPTGYNPTQGYLYGGGVSAGQVIHDAAQAYEINPQVLLTTLQKEEALVSGEAGCPTWRYASAMGYGCPDNAGSYSYSNLNPPLYYMNGNPVNSISDTCVNGVSKVGFSQQVIHAAWLLKFAEQRSEGNTGWAIIKGNWDNSDDPHSCYGGPMTQGYRKRCSTDSSAVYYDGYITIDSQSTHMDTGATAALYWYTPHFHGNQVFYNTFTSWFDPSTFIKDSLAMQNIAQPDLSPAMGQTLSYTVAFTNNLPVALTVDALGIVGRADSLDGPNRDFGWQGPITFQAGETKQFTFTTIAQQTGRLYIWPAVYYQGNYSHYNNWGALLNTHIPNIGATLSPSTPSPVVGQSDNLSVTINNYEGQAINLDAAGIPIRFFGTYNYDAAWVSSLTIPSGGSSSPISGTVTYNKAGPYTEWVSVKIGNQYITVSPIVNVNAASPSPSPQNFQLSYTTAPHLTPALGEDVTLGFTLKNTYSVPVTLDAVGVVGRYDSPYTGANRDFGWQGPETFAAGQTKSYTFVTNISELKNLYAWVAIRYQGSYAHYNNWGFMLSPHLPNLTLSVPVTVNNGDQPSLNQSTPVNATIQNNESYPIKYSAAGIPARYYGVYNYDVLWSGSGTLVAGGSLPLSGNIVFDKPGPYTLWVSILIQGRYITVGSVKNINL